MSQDNKWGDAPSGRRPGPPDIRPDPLASRIGAPAESGANVRIVLTFNPDDQAWIRRTPIAVPRFWEGHPVPPARGDVLRFGGRQFMIEARVWEHDGTTPVLRLFVGSAHAESDTVFG